MDETSAPPQEVFVLNSRATDVNVTSSDDNMCHMKATEELPTKEKIQGLITNGPSVKNHVENFRSKHSWGLLISKIPDEDGGLTQFVENYQAITKENVLAFNSICLGNGLLEPPHANQLFLDSNPATDSAHKQQFYKRAHSQMIALAIQGRLDQVSLNKLMTVNIYFYLA